MYDITVKELAEGTGGRLLMGEIKQPVGNISLDSRHMKGDDLFVPIIGERADAHNFICQAIGNGAAAVLTSRHHSASEVKAEIEAQTKGDTSLRDRCLQAAWIQVEDTKKGLQALGSFLRERIRIPLVGITGSVGKTTTREMIGAALGAGFQVYKTPGNSNSQVGVPITLSEIPREAGIGVIELGMSEPGEMTRIASIARADSAVMTNIGVTHIEQLGSQENILREKLHIQDGMPEDGCLFLNGDDPMLRQAAGELKRPVCLYGLSEGCDVRGVELETEEGYPVFTAVVRGEQVRVRLRVMGNHMVSNALAALAVAAYYKVPLSQASRALEAFEGYRGRQQVFEAGGITVLDDSYNASPVSMKAGLEVLRTMAGERRSVAVLGDMKELGPESGAFHREIGAFIGSHPVDQTVLLGELAGEIGRGIKESGIIEKGLTGHPVYCHSLDEVNQWLKEHLKEGDCVLFKGSNSMRLSQSAAFLREWKKQTKEI